MRRNGVGRPVGLVATDGAHDWPPLQRRAAASLKMALARRAVWQAAGGSNRP